MHIGMGDGAITIWDAKKVLDAGANTEGGLKMGKGCVSA